MNRVILFSFIVLALSLPSIGMAASVGNIADTQGGLGKFSLGVEYDGVFNRDLKFKSGNSSKTAGGVTVSVPYPSTGDSIKDMKLESNRIFIKGTLGLHPNIDLFLKLGMADAKWKYKYVSPGETDEKNEFDGDYDFVYGGGIKAKIFESSGGLRVMVDGQYLRYEVDGDFKVDGKDLAQIIIDDGATTASYNSKTKIQEWQVALYVNQTFGQFSPYAGVKYSDVTAKSETNFSRIDGGVALSGKLDEKAEADNNFGIIVGADIYLIPNRLSVNIEGRFIDETAGTIGVNYRF
ncbi:MAG: hypothetical protein HZB79_07035 [Deltaproteobacteria bacterium]|nr:hypothetical protein [Deltaproteobacteria bacterium]